MRKKNISNCQSFGEWKWWHISSHHIDRQSFYFLFFSRKKTEFLYDETNKQMKQMKKSIRFSVKQKNYYFHSKQQQQPKQRMQKKKPIKISFSSIRVCFIHSIITHHTYHHHHKRKIFSSIITRLISWIIKKRARDTCWFFFGQ